MSTPAFDVIESVDDVIELHQQQQQQQSTLPEISAREPIVIHGAGHMTLWVNFVKLSNDLKSKHKKFQIGLVSVIDSSQNSRFD